MPSIIMSRGSPRRALVRRRAVINFKQHFTTVISPSSAGRQAGSSDGVGCMGRGSDGVGRDGDTCVGPAAGSESGGGAGCVCHASWPRIDGLFDEASPA